MPPHRQSTNAKATMNEIQNSKDVASMLLNSSDSRVAAAARRVFSNALLVQNNPQEVHYSDTTKPSPPMVGKECIFNVQEAASAVAMLAPKNIVTTRNAITDGIVEATIPTDALSKTPSAERTTSCLKSVSPSPNPEPDAKTPARTFVSNTAGVLERKKITSPVERLERR